MSKHISSGQKKICRIVNTSVSQGKGERRRRFKQKIGTVGSSERRRDGYESENGLTQGITKMNHKLPLKWEAEKLIGIILGNSVMLKAEL